MIRPILKSALLFALLPFLSQCVSTEQVTSMDLRIRTLDTRIMGMEKTLGDIKVLTGDKGALQKMQQQQAEVSEMTDRLNTELLQVKGRQEESANLLRKSQTDNKVLREDLQKQINQLADGIKNLEKQLAEFRNQFDATASDINTIKESRVREAAERASDAVRNAEQMQQLVEKITTKEKESVTSREASGPKVIEPDKTKQKPSPEKETPEETTEDQPATVEKTAPTAEASDTPDAAATGESSYDTAMALFKDKKYKEAYNAFNSYLSQNPKGSMAANSRFWLGECLYNQDEFELAILEYQKVIADFPKHAKAASALLKQAFAFEKLNDNPTAVIVYQKLLDEYPASDQAKAAKKKIDKSN